MDDEVYTYVAVDEWELDLEAVAKESQLKFMKQAARRWFAAVIMTCKTADILSSAPEALLDSDEGFPDDTATC